MKRPVMLDNNVVAVLLDIEHPERADVYERVVLPSVNLCLSVVVHTEQMFGFAKSRVARKWRLPSYHDLLEFCPAVAWDIHAAETYALLRHAVSSRPMSTHDGLIVAHALARDAVLVTMDRNLILSYQTAEPFTLIDGRNSHGADHVVHVEDFS